MAQKCPQKSIVETYFVQINLNFLNTIQILDTSHFEDGHMRGFILLHLGAIRLLRVTMHCTHTYHNELKLVKKCNLKCVFG